MVVAYGGDGTLMKCEKDFPGIPKFLLKESRTSKKGHDIHHTEVFKKISAGKYIIEDETIVV